MCSIIEDSKKDNWDATNSWSGYNYQGKIALYLGIHKINELIISSKGKDLEKYSVEIEWLEDFSIVYTDATTRVYKSIHQVKAKENTTIKDYEDALVKLFQKIEKDSLIINAYLHVCRALDYKESTWEESVETIIRNCSQIKELKTKIEDYKNCNDDIKQRQLNKLNERGRNSEENSLIKAYNEKYFNFKKISLKNIDLIIDKILEDLEVKIKLCMKTIKQSDLKKIELYQYPTNREYCNIDEINDLLKEEIKKYWSISHAPVWKAKDEGFCENVCLYLEGLMDNHITERHKNYNKTDMRDISFQQIKAILDSDTSIERCEEYYLYVIKQRLMRQCLEYHEKCKADWEEEKCFYCEIKNFNDQLSGKTGRDIKEFLHAINPDIVNDINGEHWEEFCNQLKYRNPFFKGLRDIQAYYEKEKKYVSYAGKNKKLNLLTTINHDEDSPKDAMRVCSSIVKNPNLNDVLMDYDCLISKSLDIDSVFNSAGDYLENFKLEEDHIYHYKNLKIKSLNKSLEELEEE
jgi:hypothetical protein